MFLYQVIIIIVLIAGSVYACYTDFKHRKIKNIVSLGLVGFGISNHVIYYLWGGLSLRRILQPV